MVAEIVTTVRCRSVEEAQSFITSLRIFMEKEVSPAGMGINKIEYTLTVLSDTKRSAKRSGDTECPGDTDRSGDTECPDILDPSHELVIKTNKRLNQLSRARVLFLCRGFIAGWDMGRKAL